MSSKLVLQLNAFVGLASTAVAAAMLKLVASSPAEVASAVAGHEYRAVAQAIVLEVAGWLHALLQYL
jgi:hypothetical protein